MAYLKLAFYCRVGVAVGGLPTNRVISAIIQRFSGFATKAAGSEGAPVPAWQFWKLEAQAEAKHTAALKARAEAVIRALKVCAEAEKAKAEAVANMFSQQVESLEQTCDIHARDYKASMAEARLEILQYKYHLNARGIPELFIKALTRDANLYCYRKAQEKQITEVQRKFYADLAMNWFPQEKKELWQVILEMPTMVDFKEDMQNVLSSHDLDLLATKITSFHREFRHFHHGAIRQRKDIVFVREHIQQGIHDTTVDPLQLEGFMRAMAKKIDLNVRFVDACQVIEGED
ncbi:hypothetical protein GOP47_0003509 [Adiantum capillus-veneris]|uniref:Uncharacterized protein n=1 Tax=Adiantum capillus-veneris TaxID=13818 RepID=A0A9D4V356_ADICA|nr:hypothetical protein GOP47_0006079 [Adiantum capillus-veneris]KAI5079037.1 hypothetical protein GOP47_0006708 [Adiantum capillus-veneris]KAI5083766.1 hypothetical protein GOP47_0003509 [Adiantum capillus-veneris]